MTELLKLSLALLETTDEDQRTEIKTAIQAWVTTQQRGEDIRWTCQDLASCLFKKQEAETEIETLNQVIKTEEKKAGGWRALSFGTDHKVRQKAQQDITDAQSRIEDLDKEIKRLKKIVKAWEQTEKDHQELETWKANDYTGPEPSIFVREREELVKGCTRLRVRRTNIIIT
jgi:predicted  nucleic acid-binding Zn-ribbon protein